MDNNILGSIEKPTKILVISAVIYIIHFQLSFRTQHIFELLKRKRYYKKKKVCNKLCLKCITDHHQPIHSLTADTLITTKECDKELGSSPPVMQQICIKMILLGMRSNPWLYYCI